MRMASAGESVLFQEHMEQLERTGGVSVGGGADGEQLDETT